MFVKVINKNMLYGLEGYISLLAVALIFIVTGITTQHIALDYAFIYSGDALLYDTAIGNGSIVSSLIRLFGDMSSEVVSIVYSVTISIISIAGVVFYARGYRLTAYDISVVLGLVFMVDKTGVVGGLNYPLTILDVESNTMGEIGLAFSILSIAAYKKGNKTGLFTLSSAILVHPTLGMLSAAYISLDFLIKKRYSSFIYPLLICAVYVLINSNKIPSDAGNILDFIDIMDVHRREIVLDDLAVLFFPVALMVTTKFRRKFYVDWAFVVVCILLSYLYYNLKIDFFRYEVLALMPSRGVNIAISMIVIKYYVYLLRSPSLVGFIFPALFFVIIESVPDAILGTYIILSLLHLYSKREVYALALLSLFVLVSNIKTFSLNMNDEPYDEFFRDNNGYVLNLVSDYSLMVRNSGVIEVFPASVMDAYSYNPTGFIVVNQLFFDLFGRNLWELSSQKDKCGCISYSDISEFSIQAASSGRGSNLKYVIAPSSSDLNLNIVWKNQDVDVVIYEVN